MSQTDDSETIEPYITRTTLFARDLYHGLTKDEAREILQRVCPKHQGRIIVPLDHNTRSFLGVGYLNFNTKDEAESALKQWRFQLIVRGRPAKLMYAIENKEVRDKYSGSWGLRFYVIVKNLSPEVEATTLCDKFSEFGEIFQLKLDKDQWGQCFAMIQYVHEWSVKLAVARANNTILRGHNTVITVELHHRAGFSKRYSQNYEEQISPESDNSSMSVYQNNSFTENRSEQVGDTYTVGSDDLGNEDEYAESYVTETPLYQPVQQTNSGQPPLPYPAASDAPVMIIPQVAMPELSHQKVAYSPHLPPPTSAGAPLMPQQAVPPVPAAYPQQLAQPFRPYAPISTDANLPVAVAAQPPPVERSQGPFMKLQSHMKLGHDLPLGASVAGEPSLTADIPANLSQRSLLMGEPSNGSVSYDAVAPTTDMRSMLRGAHGIVLGLASRMDAAVHLTERMVEVLCCPITQEPFREPVVAADGFTYERQAIENWLLSNDTSPMTSDKLASKSLLPNNLAKQLLADLVGFY